MSPQPTPAFNLLDEPWIPARFIDGTVRDVSLTEAMLAGEQISALAETAPPNLIALYRLLLSCLHRALTTEYGPWKDSDRARWYREGLPRDAIGAYLTQWRERFWLFHPTHPFMQVAGLAEWGETKEKHKPWTQISIGAASGNTAVVFDHAMDENPADVSPAFGFRALLGLMQCVPGGLVKSLRDSDKAGPLANAAAVMPLGENLAQTLLLGLAPPTPIQVNDLPAWERHAPAIAELQGPPQLATGPNDRYTRLTRAVMLIPTADLSGIEWVRFAAGRALEEDPHAPDPMLSYRINQEGQTIPITFSEGRAIWRDLPALLPDPSGKANQPPAVLAWATALYDRLGRMDQPIPVLIAGMASKKAKLLRWRGERFDLPPRIMGDPDAALELRSRIQAAEVVYTRLRGLCIEMFQATMPDPRHKDTRARAQELVDRGPTGPAFWTAAERAIPGLLQHLASADVEAATDHWAAALHSGAKNAWRTACRSLGESPRALRAVARADARFTQLLSSLEPTEPAAATAQSDP